MYLKFYDILIQAWGVRVFICSKNDLRQLTLCYIHQRGRWVITKFILISLSLISLFSYVPSEAAAGLILKTKSAALRDGDRIIAVVRSTDVKHDGRSQGLVAPNVKAQIDMQISLLEKAGLSPAQIE